MNKLILKPFNNKILISVIKRHCHQENKTNFCKFTSQNNEIQNFNDLYLKVVKIDKDITDIKNTVVYIYMFNIITIPLLFLTI